MAIRSHVDPSLFVVFIHVQGEALTEDLEDVVASLNVRHGDSFQPLLEKLSARTHQLVFHETYHFWQGLRLPFLFRYALLSFRHAMQAFGQLSRRSPDFTDWACGLPEFERLSAPSELGLYPNGEIIWGSSLEAAKAAPKQKLKITPLLLLETGASIAEFQVTTTTGRTNPTAFRRWCKRNPAYLELIDVCAAFFGSDELPLRCLLPLINAAFHTSLPERALALLLARTWKFVANPDEDAKAFLNRPEPCRWTDVYRVWLDEIDFDAEPDVARIAEGQFFRLDLDKWVFGNFGGKDELTHPFLGPLARRWRELEASRPALSYLLDQPGMAGGDTFGLCMQEFLPPVAIYRFHLPAGKGKVVLHGSLNTPAFKIGVSLDEAEYRGFIADVLSMYGAVRAASGAHFDADQRTCHHANCQYYSRNLCNAYPIVPARFSDCGFPSRLTRLISTWRT